MAKTAPSPLVPINQQEMQTNEVMIIEILKVSKNLYGDCKSALSLATTETGPWRTRHLRLRAHRLREALRTSATDPQQEPAWSARHLGGNDLVADGLTKPLLGASFVRFASRLSLHGSWLNNMEDGATCVKKCNSSRPSSVEDSHEETGKRLIAIGSLLIRGLSAVVTRCGHILIAVGAMLIGEKEDENGNVEAERGRPTIKKVLDYVLSVFQDNTQNKPRFVLPEPPWSLKLVNVDMQLAPGNLTERSRSSRM